MEKAAPSLEGAAFFLSAEVDDQSSMRKLRSCSDRLG
jgi:hypothetical protein